MDNLSALSSEINCPAALAVNTLVSIVVAPPPKASEKLPALGRETLVPIEVSTKLFVADAPIAGDLYQYNWPFTPPAPVLVSHPISIPEVLYPEGMT